jgi:hypothetical protein
MLAKRYRLKIATWTVVREPSQPSRHRLQAGRLGHPGPYLRRIPRSVITSNRPLSSCWKRYAK